jgi:hypothetical protein
MTAYRLRVEVPLEPADASTVATAIDELGGDIIAVDLREVDGTRAIDELVVEFANARDIDTLSSTLDTQRSATLLSTQRCPPGEPANQARIRMRTAAERASTESGIDLAAQLRAACPMTRVDVRAVDAARDLPVVSLALARGGPVVQRQVASAIATGPTTRPVSKWLLAAADSYLDAGQIALLERPIAYRFSAHDAAKVHLLIEATRH